MSNYKDTMAYKLYKRAEENLESGVAVNNLVDKILKEVISAVDFGETMTRINIEPAHIQIASEAKVALEDMGFKAISINEKKWCLSGTSQKRKLKKKRGLGNDRS